MGKIDRKDSFNLGAEIYDASRPEYPEEMIDFLKERNLFHPGMRLLEIGSGTGKSTVPFAKAGAWVTCLEPSPEMCGRLRKNLSTFQSVQIIQTSFENYKPEKAEFDIISAANSFHWLDKASKYRQSSSLLSDHGLLLLIYNFPHYRNNALLHRGYRILADYSEQKIFYESEQYSEGMKKIMAEEINDSHYFRVIDYKEINWQRSQTLASMAEGIMSHSAFLSLDDESREKCSLALGGGFPEKDKEVITHMCTILFACRKEKRG